MITLGGRLHRKILIMMMGVGLTPFLVLGGVALYSLNLFHRIDVARIEDNVINQKIEEVRAEIDEIINTFQIKVSFSQVADIELSSQNFLLSQLLEEVPELEEVAFVNLTGKETSRFNRKNMEGVPFGELRDISRIDLFSSARRKENYLSPAHFTLSGPVITIASPVLNRDGVVISVLEGEINLSKIQKIFERSVLGNDGYLYLVDRDGFLIASSKVEKFTPKSFRGVNFVSDIISGRNKGGVQGQKRYTSFWGEPVVAAGKSLSQFGWYIVAEWPTKDADRVLSTIRSQMMGVGLFVLFATLLASIILANRIVKPIKELEGGAKRVAGGKFDEAIDIHTHDEIEDLGLAFNDMMGGLKRLQELKDEFVFVAAHELRTPVTAIKGYISMALEMGSGTINDQVKKFLEEVKKASERLNQLVNDLLQIARSEAGRLEVKTSPVAIIDTINQILSELAPLALEKSISLVYKPESALPQVNADQDRLKEVLVNLIGNAIKYTIGSGTVTITHELIGKELVTHIRDTGMGMSLDAQKKLFQKFYRVQNENTRKITGTGLGLFIVKELISRMNGRIWVESEEGRGTVFSFSLSIV